MKILSTLNATTNLLFRVTGPKPNRRNEMEKEERNVDLGEFMVTESDIGLPTYGGIF